MSTTAAELSNQAKGPKCAGCGKRPPVFDIHMMPTATGLVLGLLYCRDCGEIVPAFSMGQQQPLAVRGLRLQA